VGQARLPFTCRRDGPAGRLCVWAASFSLVAIAALSACGDSEDVRDNGPGNSPVATPINNQYLPIVISDDLAVGPQRFQVGLLEQTNDGQTPVAGAQLHFKFYLLDETGKGAEKFETDAQAIVVNKSYTHTHPDGTVETHEAGETGAYVAHPDFDTAGQWGVEVTGSLSDGTNIVRDGEQPVVTSFPVRERSAGLAVGDPAPASEQLLASDVADIRSIDTSLNPIVEQHNMTIADAIVSGKPTVIAFATPAFCQTQICGPAKEIFDTMYESYKGQANFIHIEPYDVPKVRSGECTNYGDCLTKPVLDFGLQTEPWIFIIDAKGKVSAKYEGIVSEEEIEDGLAAVLPQ